MKTAIVFVLSCTFFLCCAWAGSSLASGNPNEVDNIGIYLDETGDAFCTEQVSGLFPTYLVLTGLSSESILGWEAKIPIEGGGLRVGEAIMGQAVNVGTRVDEYIVGLAEPLFTVDGSVMVMRMDILIMDEDDPVLGYAGPIYFHAGSEPLPCYLDGVNPNEPKYLYPSLGDLDQPVFMANTDCKGPVSTEARIWGDLKARYR